MGEAPTVSWAGGNLPSALPSALPPLPHGERVFHWLQLIIHSLIHVFSHFLIQSNFFLPQPNPHYSSGWMAKEESAEKGQNAIIRPFCPPPVHPVSPFSPNNKLVLINYPSFLVLGLALSCLLTLEGFKREVLFAAFLSHSSKNACWCCWLTVLA